MISFHDYRLMGNIISSSKHNMSYNYRPEIMNFMYSQWNYISWLYRTFSDETSNNSNVMKLLVTLLIIGLTGYRQYTSEQDILQCDTLEITYTIYEHLGTELDESSMIYEPWYLRRCDNLFGNISIQLAREHWCKIAIGLIPSGKPW